MNFTTFNRTIISCGLHYLPIYPENISLDLSAVFIIRIVVSALTCPLTILLNILVMVAVKTTLQLRTKSNIALACLATTDLVVWLFCSTFTYHTRKCSSEWSRKHILQSKRSISYSNLHMFVGIVYSFNSVECRALCRGKTPLRVWQPGDRSSYHDSLWSGVDYSFSASLGKTLPNWIKFCENLCSFYSYTSFAVFSSDDLF